VDKVMSEKDQRAAKDQAYLERNMLVALLASLYPSGRARTAITGWNEEWHGCVYIDFPWGQASWHFHDSHAHLFAHLPEYSGAWDGHTTEEKYRRILFAAQNTRIPAQPAATGGADSALLAELADWHRTAGLCNYKPQDYHIPTMMKELQLFLGKLLAELQPPALDAEVRISRKDAEQINSTLRARANWHMSRVDKDDYQYGLTLFDIANRVVDAMSATAPLTQQQAQKHESSEAVSPHGHDWSSGKTGEQQAQGKCERADCRMHGTSICVGSYEAQPFGGEGCGTLLGKNDRDHNEWCGHPKACHAPADQQAGEQEKV